MPGSAILVNWTVANQGGSDTAVSTWQDDVYIDTGSTLDSNAVLLGSFTHNGLLNAGGSYSQSQLVTLPINLLGTYNLFVVTNASNSVYETDTQQRHLRASADHDQSPTAGQRLGPAARNGGGGTGATGQAVAGRAATGQAVAGPGGGGTVEASGTLRSPICNRLR